jgi:glucuronate isomerase
MAEEETFLGPNWLLDTKEARRLYHEVAIPLREEVGIVDTHTHHNLRQIVENRPFLNIWRAEVLEPREQYANNDHYIIQLAAKIHGFSQALARDRDISDYDKWMALSRVFPELEGNHVHQWLHLDLRRMFGIDLLLNGNTGDVIWEAANKRLQEKEMLPQAILRKIEQGLSVPQMILQTTCAITKWRKIYMALRFCQPSGQMPIAISSAMIGGQRSKGSVG